MKEVESELMEIKNLLKILIERIQPTIKEKDYYSLAETAKILNRSEKTVKRYIETLNIYRKVSPNGKYKIHKEDVDRMKVVF